jgi:hypothetical protein
MRQLTASQKIAILENRVAQLEKQAMLEGLKVKIADAMSPFKRLVPQTKKIIKDTRKSPKQIAQEYMRVRKDPNFKKAVKQIQREAGSSPVKQVTYVIDAYKSGELESTSRTASMRRRGFLAAVGFSGAILAVIYIVGICVHWVMSKARGLLKLGSMDKEALIGPGFIITLVFSIAFFLAGYVWGYDYGGGRCRGRSCGGGGYSGGGYSGGGYSGGDFYYFPTNHYHHDSSSDFFDDGFDFTDD